jgi:hypothetical protein
MPKRDTKKRKGGSWYDPSSWTNNNSSYTSNSSNSWNPFASDNVDTTSWNPFASKKPGYSSYQSQPSYGEQSSYGQQPSSGYGGKKKHTRRSKRGGSFSPNMSRTNLASTASPVSGIQTVKAQTWVGGKTRRRNNRHKKSRKH